MTLKTDQEKLAWSTPRNIANFRFPIDEEIWITEIVRDKKHPTGYAHIKWGKTEVPLVQFEGGGIEPVYLPLSIFTNCVETKIPIHNPDNKSLSCVELEGNRILERIRIYYLHHIITTKSHTNQSTNYENMLLNQPYKNGTSILEYLMPNGLELVLPNCFYIQQRIKVGCRAMDIYDKSLYSSEFFACIQNDEGFKGRIPNSFEEYVRASDGVIPKLYMGNSGLPQFSYTYIVFPFELEFPK